MSETPTTEKAQAAASTAADEGKHVAGVAQGEAAKVATEAKEQVKSVAGEARTQVTQQVSDQTKTQRDKLVTTLGSLGDDLDGMAEQSQGGLAADIAREAAAHARSLTSYLDGREPTELLDDVRDFARRRPGVFLAGALVAGIVAGRVTRGVKDAGSDNSPSFGGSPAQPSTPAPSYGAPPVPPTPPPFDPPSTYAEPLEAPPVNTPPGQPTGLPTSPPPYSSGPAAGGLS